MIEFIKQLIRLLLLLFFQLAVFNHIGLHGLFNPFIYIFFILMLPLSTPMSLLLLLGFSTGLVVDIFSNTGGIHAFATTLIAFIRPFWIKTTIQRTAYDDLQNISFRDVEFGQYVTYVSLLIFIHNLALYSIESLDISDIFVILMKAIFSALLTTLLIIALRYLELRPPRTT
jgi:rod shape-determining protein MreD